MEHLTDELERMAVAYIDHIDAIGGMLAAIEAGYVNREIQEASYQFQQALENNEAVVVGVNQFVEEETVGPDLLHLDPAIEATQRKTDRSASET